MLKFFFIFTTLDCKLYFSTIIAFSTNIALNRFVFSWSKILVGFIPDDFSKILMYKILKISATIDSLLTSFSPSKREIAFPEMILLFVKMGLNVSHPFKGHPIKGLSFLLPKSKE